MFFSVIVPVYNVEKYLSACIDSVLKQSFRDYELILIDDGSRDSSGAICDEYAGRDGRIKVIHKENGGLSDARNVGTACASGTYIVYIDSDDFVTSDSFLEDIYQKVQVTGSDIVLYKFSKFSDDAQELSDCTFSLAFMDQIADGDELWYELVRRDSYYGMAWIKAFRRECAVSNGICFEEGLLGEDMDWYFSLVLQAENICVIDRSYIAYRQRSGSITNSLKMKNLTDFVYILEKWSERIQREQIGERKKTALMGALAKYYANLLITYSRLRDKEKRAYVQRIKELSYLLDYGISTRPVQIRRMYRMTGFGGVVFALTLLDKLRK